jgi:hypothetical protein
MIFFGGVGSALVAVNQVLATEKIPKKRKNACKYAKYSRSDPGFPAERVGFWGTEFASCSACAGYPRINIEITVEYGNTQKADSSSR